MKQFFIASVACMILVVDVCSGQAGVLDPSFGSDGVVVTTFLNTYSWGRKVLVQPDGKIISYIRTQTNVINGDYAGSPVITESIGVARYNIDGSLDQSFAVSGVFQLYDGITTDELLPPSALLQPDGKILIPTTTLNIDSDLDFTIYRLNSDGSLDTSFGNKGIAQAGHHGNDVIAVNITLLPDGRIIQSGKSSPDNRSVFYDILVRYLPNGQIDSTFGTNGLVDSILQYDAELSLKLLPSGKFLLIEQSMSIAQFNADGSLDTEFQLLYNSNNVYGIRAVALGGNGSIFLGLIDSPVCIIKLTPQCKIDTSFNHTGHNAENILGPGAVVDMAIQQDGKIVVLAVVDYISYLVNYNVYTGTIALVRYTVDGRVDSSFGTDGVFLLDTNIVKGQYAASMAIQPDGKILIDGNGTTATGSGPMLVRLLTDLNLGIIGADNSSATTEVYPNPIHQQATVSYELSKDEMVSIGLYDMEGRKVQTLSDNEMRQAGCNEQKINIDAAIRAGSYILRVETADGMSTSVKVIVK